MAMDSPDRHPAAMTIAGSDPSGGAGLQADLKTFQQLGVYGMSAVTLITVQNTQGVRQVQVLDPDLVAAQIDAVLDDIAPQAIKTGALGSAAVVRVVASRLTRIGCPVVVDPVLISKHGHALASDDTVAAVREQLLPLATWVTPNRMEAESLTGIAFDHESAGERVVERLQSLGVPHPLVKVGKSDSKAIHWLGEAGQVSEIAVPWKEEANLHGSGCVLAAALTARLALGDCQAIEAARFAVDQTSRAIGSPYRQGTGIYPADVLALEAQP